MKLVSLHSLYNEICWESLECWRNNHKLALLYKIVHNIIPLYLSSLLPQSVSNISRYNIRNSNDLQTTDTRTNQFHMSFLPSSVRAWNNLSVKVQQCDSVASFKRFFHKDNSKVPQHFYSGCRKSQILLTNLRTNCSSLNFDHCTFYHAQRNELINAVSISISLP